MDFERLERAWRSTANSPTEAASAYLMEETMTALKKRRQSFNGFTGLIGLALALWTAKIAYDVVFNPFPFDLAREWAAIPLLAFPFVSLWVVRAQYQRHLKAHPDPYVSMPATLRALIDENATAQRRIRFMAAGTLAFVAVMALMLGQLQAVGKMSAQNVLQGSVMFGGILGAIWIYQAVNYVHKLKPEGERLKRLLAEYASAPV